MPGEPRLVQPIDDGVVSFERNAAEVSPTVAVLVPCLNEAGTVAQVVTDLRRLLPDATVYVFDNNSTDGTGR